MPLEEMDAAGLTELMRGAAGQVLAYFQARTGGRPRTLLIVLDDRSRLHYISNCGDGDMIAALRSTADRIEARADVPG